MGAYSSLSIGSGVLAIAILPCVASFLEKLVPHRPGRGSLFWTPSFLGCTPLSRPFRTCSTLGLASSARCLLNDYIRNEPITHMMSSHSLVHRYIGAGERGRAGPGRAIGQGSGAGHKLQPVYECLTGARVRGLIPYSMAWHFDCSK